VIIFAQCLLSAFTVISLIAFSAVTLLVGWLDYIVGRFGWTPSQLINDAALSGFHRLGTLWAPG